MISLPGCLFCLQASMALSSWTDAMTFADDVRFLESQADVHVLKAADGAVVAVSPLLSGRVMTSAFAESEEGFGLVYRPAIEAGPLQRGFSNYGGEDRLWLAPEGGPYALYFDPGSPQSVEHWFVPLSFDGGARTPVDKSDTHITFRNRIEVLNQQGQSFDLTVERSIRLLPREEVSKLLGENLPQDSRCVAYASENRVQLHGTLPEQDTPLIGIWILGQFKPSARTYVLVPYQGQADFKSDYFGPVPASRLHIRATGRDRGHARFTADGNRRTKIGLAPDSATGWLGAVHPEREALTLVHHSLPTQGAAVPDCDWKNPNPNAAKGDVATSYNNFGEPAFFELESLSAALPPGENPKLDHHHITIHLDGNTSFLTRLRQEKL